MVELKCMLEVYGRKEGRVHGRVTFDSISLILVFSFINLVYVYAFMSPLSPQAQSGSKIWEIVHNAGKLWQFFPKLCAKKYSHSIII